MHVDTNLSHGEYIPGNQTCALSSCFVRTCPWCPSCAISTTLCLSVSGTTILSPLTTIPSTTASLLITCLYACKFPAFASIQPLWMHPFNASSVGSSSVAFCTCSLVTALGGVACYNIVHVAFHFLGSFKFELGASLKWHRVS